MTPLTCNRNGNVTTVTFCPQKLRDYLDSTTDRTLVVRDLDGIFAGLAWVPTLKTVFQKL